MHPRRIAAVLLLLPALPLLGAEVRLGPETPVVPVQFAPAAYAQYSPTFASNGRDFLAVWLDGREQASSDYGLYAARLAADGAPLDPLGRKLAVADGIGGVAFGGGSYLVFYSRYDESIRQSRFFLLPLDETATPRGPERELDRTVFRNGAFSLRSNGSTFLMFTYRESTYQYVAVSIDRDGAILGEQVIGSARCDSGGFDRPYVTVNAGHYDVLGYLRDCNGSRRPVLKTIDDHAGDMTVTETRFPLRVPDPSFTPDTVAVSSDRILFAFSSFAFSSGGRLEIVLCDRSGQVVVPATTLEVVSGDISSLTVLSDGRDFLITRGASDSSGYSVKSIVVDANRTLRSGWFSTAWPLSLASNGTTQLVGWTDRRWSPNGDVVALPLDGLAELAVSSKDPVPFAFSGRPQRDVRIAWAHGQSMTVWCDESGREILAGIAGTEISVDRVVEKSVGMPSVAAAGDRFLVAWYEQEGATATRLRARRYTFGGTPIDPEPFTVTSSKTKKRYLGTAPGVSADGTSFLITDDRPIGLLRVDAQTGLVSELWRYDPGDDGWGPGPPIKTASEWIVPYCSYYGFFSPHIDTTWRASWLRMPLSGNGPQVDRTSVTFGTGGCGRVGTTAAGDRHAVVGPFLKFAGGSIGTLLPRSDAEHTEYADIAWNGSEYVAVWTVENGGPTRGMRFDVEGRPLDLEPFELAPSGSTGGSRPSIAVTGDGVIIVYSRAAGENGDAPRAFTRTLARLPEAPPRRPAARH